MGNHIRLHARTRTKVPNLALPLSCLANGRYSPSDNICCRSGKGYGKRFPLTIIIGIALAFISLRILDKVTDWDALGLTNQSTSQGNRHPSLPQ